MHQKKKCRICLESEDVEDNMIAPCACQGSSKWIHSRCLDEWRATNQQDIAFSQCTECHFDYHMEVRDTSTPTGRRLKYCCLVSRDVAASIMLLQLIILLLGILTIGGASTTDVGRQVYNTHGWLLFGAIYINGFITLLICLGIYGIFLFLRNDCSLERSMNALDSPPLQPQIYIPVAEPVVLVAGIPAVANSMSDRNAEEALEVYLDSLTHGEDHQQGQERQQSSSTNNTDYDCCLVCQDCLPLCGGCNALQSCAADNRRSSQSDDHCHSDSCQCCDGNSSCTIGDCDNNKIGIFVFVLCVILATIGFVVGAFIGTVAVHRILDRHLLVLHKRRLVSDFGVKDLSEHDPQKTGSQSHSATTPRLSKSDRDHLSKLGLTA